MKNNFKLIRHEETKGRFSENDERRFFFCKDVDIVLTTISKKHIEPAHLHKENTETYFVLKGKLALYVNNEKIDLNEFDLAIVYPGACHYFETYEEEVVFLAMKKEPGLKDKVAC